MLATMTRTDAHRPSAINPADYRFVACDYLGGGMVGQEFSWDRRAFHADMEKTGARFAPHQSGGTCHICGAGALYIARYHHAPSNTYINTGMDCADKMGIGDADAFRNFRKMVAGERKAAKGKARARETLVCLGFSVAIEVFDTPGERTGPAVVIADIVGKLARYGSLSPAQIAFLDRLIVGIPAQKAKADERAAAAAVAPVSQHVGKIGERREFTLTVEFKTDWETAFGVTYLNGFKDAAGNVFIHMGSPIFGDVAKGETVTVKATIKEHGERNGVAQTIIARPAIVARPKLAKEAA